jgi:hypothetical protein
LELYGTYKRSHAFDVASRVRGVKRLPKWQGKVTRLGSLSERVSVAFQGGNTVLECRIGQSWRRWFGKRP